MQFRQSLETSDRKVAERLLRDRMNDFDRMAGRDGSLDGINFAGLAEKYLESQIDLKPKTHQRRRESFDATLLETFGNLPVRNVERNLTHWMIARKAQVSGRTFNIDRESLKLVMDHAEALKLIARNPVYDVVPRLKEVKKVPQIASPEEFTKVLAELRTIRGESADLIKFFAYTGMRTGEATKVTWADVDIKLKVHVTGGQYGPKNSRERMGEMFAPLHRLLAGMLHRNPFAKLSDRVFTINSARQQLADACIRAGVPAMHHHHVRHFFASLATEQGVDFPTLAWLGHRNGGALVARTYTHVRCNHSREMAKRMSFDACAPAVVPEPGNAVQMSA